MTAIFKTLNGRKAEVLELVITELRTTHMPNDIDSVITTDEVAICKDIESGKVFRLAPWNIERLIDWEEIPVYRHTKHETVWHYEEDEAC